MAQALMTAEQVRELAERAFVALDAHHEGRSIFREEDEELRAQRHADWVAAQSALRFCAVQAAALADPSLLDLLQDIHLELVDWRHEPPSHHLAVCDAIQRLVSLEESPSKVTRQLASDREAGVRAAVASGLTAEGAAVAVLEKLAEDVSADVRTRARARLEERGQVAWWRGIFKSDPAQRLAANDLDRLAPVFQQLKAVVETPFWAHADRAGPLPGLVRQLPDELALEFMEPALLSEEYVGPPVVEAFADTFSRPGAAELLQRAADHHQHDYGWMQMERLVGSAADLMAVPVREALSLQLFKLAAATPRETWEEMGNPGPALACCAEKLWPAESAADAVLELALSVAPKGDGEDERYRNEWVISRMGNALAASKADVSQLLPRVLAARLEGYPGSWRAIARSMDGWLDRAPGPVLRPTAEAAIARDDVETVKWGLRQLLGPAYDAARDGTPLQLVERLMEMPKTRAALLDDHALRPRTVTVLRRALRGGTADFRVAVAAVEVIGRLWGGVSEPHALHFGIEDHAEHTEDLRSAERVKCEAFLGPEELHGPVTEEEWRLFRAARAGFNPAARREWRNLLDQFPPGPWHPEDWACLQRAMQAVRDGDHKVSLPIAMALSGKLQPEDEAVWDELLATLTGEDREWVEGARERTRECMGIRKHRRRRGKRTPADGGPKQWMDEDD